MLVLLAKLGNPTMVGQYGLALAIATPVFALSTLQLRAVLTTDVEERVHFGEYLGFRLLTTVLSLVIIAGAAFAMHYSAQSTWVVLIIGVAQGLEIVSDLYYAKMQFHEHMDRIAKSMIVRGIIGLAAMGAGSISPGALFGARSASWSPARSYLLHTTFESELTSTGTVFRKSRTRWKNSRRATSRYGRGGIAWSRSNCCVRR